MAGLPVLLLALAGCGEKMPLPSNIPDNPDGSLVDTVYIAVSPAWTEAGGIPFRRPFGVAVGYDRTLYICDTDNDRIVHLNTDGSFIESFAVPAPVAVAQDRGFNLVCVNRSQTIWLRRYLDRGGFEPFIAPDSIYVCIPTLSGPVCFWRNSIFYDVAASPEIDGQFFVVDNEYGLVLRFSVEFPFLQLALDTTIVRGPFSVAAGPSREGYRIYVSLYADIDGVLYFDGRTRSRVDLPDSADIFSRTPLGYKLITADDLGNVYVLNQPTSEIFKFNRRGEFLLSFGRVGEDLLSLKDPVDIAVLGETVYIADMRNNRIVRYQFAAVPEG